MEKEKDPGQEKIELRKKIQKGPRLPCFFCRAPGTLSCLGPPRRLAERFRGLGANPGASSPEEFSARIRDAFFDPIKRPDRFGEVCMVVRRPSGTLLLTTKDFYPRGAFRLPTGGIGHGEGILDALLRETNEETGLTAEVRRFLAWIEYEGSGEGRVVFHTFAFLLDETGGTLGSLDPHERIAAYREAAPEDMAGIADHLDSIASELSPDIQGDWADWGRFRAVVHRAVAEALA